MDEACKIFTPTKKDLHNFVNFPLAPQKYRSHQRMADRLTVTPQNNFIVTLQKNSSMGGGGGRTLNVMVQAS